MSLEKKIRFCSGREVKKQVGPATDVKNKRAAAAAIDVNVERKRAYFGPRVS